MHRSVRFSSWPIAAALLLAGCAAPAAPAPATSAPAASAPTQPPPTPAAAKPQPTAAPANPQPTAAAAAKPAPASPVAAPAVAASAVAKPGTKVRLGALGSVSDSGLWIALARGYFAQEGIDVELGSFATAADMIAPLSVGQLDVGGGAPGVGLDNAALRNIPIKIVADKADTAPGHGYSGILVRKDLVDSGAVTGPAGLKGRKFALSSTTGIPTEANLWKYMQRAGLQARDLDLVTLSFPEMVAAFKSKALDGAIMIEPFLTQVVEAGDATLMERADVTNPNHQEAVLLYSADFAQRRDLATSFMKAYLRGVRDYNDAFTKNDAAKRSDIVSILTQYTTVKDPALYAKMVMPGLDPNGTVNAASLKADQDYYIAANLQEKPADIDGIIDPSFARAAAEQLGQY